MKTIKILMMVVAVFVITSCGPKTTDEKEVQKNVIESHQWQKINYSMLTVEGVEYIIFTTINSSGSGVSIDVQNHTYQKYLVQQINKK